jgi:hypothetical protein
MVGETGRARGTWLWLKPILLLFVPVLVIYTLTLNSLWTTDHTESFLQLEWAIWKNHSFALGPVSTFTTPTVDDFKYRGYYYIAAAPGLSVMALPFGIIGFMMDRVFSPFGKGLLYSEFFVALTNAVATYVVFRIGRMFFKAKTSYFLAFAYAFATITWPYATFLFVSDTSSMFDLIVVFLALTIARKREKAGVAYWAGCGLAVAAGLTVDYVNAILIPIIVGFLVIEQLLQGITQKRTTLIRNYIAFLLSSAIGIVLIGSYNLINFGNFFTGSEQIYIHSSTFLGTFDYPVWNGIILNLFTPFRGLFIFCPILILGIPGYYLMIRAKQFPREEIFFLLAVFLILLLPYSAWYDVAGGLSYGARFVVPSIPFLLIPAGSLIDKQQKKYPWIIAGSLYVLSAVINGIAALVSALGPGDPPVGYSFWTYFPFLSSGPSNTATFVNFLHGVIDSWWEPWLGSSWWLGALAIIAAALILPLIVYRSEKL